MTSTANNRDVNIHGNGALRRRIASKSPAWLRKAVRMAEHYGRRQKQWAQTLRDIRGAHAKDSVILWTSALVAPITALRRLDGFEPPMLLARAAVRVRNAGYFEVRAGADDIIAVLPSREPHVCHIVERYLKSGDTFIDAGANLGLFSIIAHRRVGAEGRIVAIEMMSDTASLLRRNLDLNGVRNASVVERALADEGGKEVAAVAFEHKHGQASIGLREVPKGSRTVRVRTVRLDEILADVPRIALIKMDLEGAELGALKGATGILPRVAAIVFENNCEDPLIVELLASYGFTIRHLSVHDYLAVRGVG